MAEERARTKAQRRHIAHELRAQRGEIQTEIERRQLQQQAEFERHRLELEKQAVELDRRVHELDQRASASERQEEDLSRRTAELNARFIELDQNAPQLKDRAAALERQSKDLAAQAAALKQRETALAQQHAESDRRFAELNRQLAEFERRAADSDRQATELHRRAGELNERSVDLDRRQDEQERRAAEHAQHQAEWQQKLDELNRRAASCSTNSRRRWNSFPTKWTPARPKWTSRSPRQPRRTPVMPSWSQECKPSSPSCGVGCMTLRRPSDRRSRASNRPKPHRRPPRPSSSRCAAGEAARSDTATARAELDALRAELQANRTAVEKAKADADAARTETHSAKSEWRGWPRNRRRPIPPNCRSFAPTRDQLKRRLADAQAKASAGGEDSEDLQRRFEMAIQDVRELKAQNAELEEKLSRARAGVLTGTTPGAGGNNFDWESQKRKMLASLDSDFDGNDEQDQKDRQTIEDTVRITDQVVAQKDHEIAELRELLENQSANIGSMAVGAAAVAAVLDQDELIGQERRRLAELENEWREKLRAAEVEMSVERAKIARERLALQDEARRSNSASRKSVRWTRAAPGRRMLERNRDDSGSAGWGFAKRTRIDSRRADFAASRGLDPAGEPAGSL